MSHLQLVTYPGPVLRKRAKSIESVNEKLIEVAEAMFEVMYDHSGIGLAAPQVGLSSRLLVLDTRDEGQPEYIMINPRITRREGEIDGEEGCLSLPQLFGEVTRAEIIEVAYVDHNGEEQKMEAEGLLARAIQHEIDHLNGVLFIDRLGKSCRKALDRQLREMTNETKEGDTDDSAK